MIREKVSNESECKVRVQHRVRHYPRGKEEKAANDCSDTYEATAVSHTSEMPRVSVAGGMGREGEKKKMVEALSSTRKRMNKHGLREDDQQIRGVFAASLR